MSLHGSWALSFHHAVVKQNTTFSNRKRKTKWNNSNLEVDAFLFKLYFFCFNVKQYIIICVTNTWMNEYSPLITTWGYERTHNVQIEDWQPDRSWNVTFLLTVISHEDNLSEWLGFFLQLDTFYWLFHMGLLWYRLLPVVPLRGVL